MNIMSMREQSSDFKKRPVPRFKKPLIPFLRIPGNFSRRPAFSLRTRMMSGRYPNMGYRPFARPVYRPDCLMPPAEAPEFKHHCDLNLSRGMILPVAPRPPFPNAPFNNAFANRSSQVHLPARSSVDMTYAQNQISSVESLEPRNQVNELNMQSDLWVEALAPGGGKYFFNARTRQSMWNKPINGQIIDLDAIKRLRECSGAVYAQNPPNENNNRFLQPRSIDPFNNSFVPRNCPVAPRFFMFPPPQNVCNPPQNIYNPPQIICAPTENFSDVIRCSFNPISPADFQFPVHENSVGNNDTVDSHAAFDSNEEESKTSEQVEFQMLNKGNKHGYGENKILDWSISESTASLCSTANEEEINSSESVEENMILQENTDVSDCLKTENEAHQSPKPVNSPVTEKGSVFSDEASKNIEQEPQVDKSRPISSTPVSGTSWNIVWTGDGRVFFYDSHNKVSIWNRPVELINRTDVDKLITKPPMSLDFKTEKKEVRKTTSGGSDVIKKLKMEEKDDENNQLGDNFEVKVEIVEEKNGSKLDDIPHERKVEIFYEMLTENKISPFSTWEKELHKIVYDSRYLLLLSKERKQVFEMYMSKKMEDEKTGRLKDLLNQREGFIALLEEAGVTPNSRFSDFARCHGKDVRFKSIEKLKQRENMFNQYVSELLKKDHENEKIKAEQKKRFTELLNEQIFSKENFTWPEFQKLISNDERYKAIHSNSLKERIFKEYIRERTSRIATIEKEDRIHVSLRNREEEVKRHLSVHLKNREREQELHKHKSAVSDFRALLNDLIRRPETSWHSAKKVLKQDHRWEHVKHLESGKHEELFDQHIESLNSKKRCQFHQMLDEMPSITLKSSWLDIRKLVLSDPRCIKFSSSERKCEKEFKEYLREKTYLVKTEFKQLLRETKLINYKSKSLLADTNHLEDIEVALSKDRRYLNLDCMRSERKEILLAYIDRLHNEGPPPPPTAVEPSNRAKVNK